MTRDRVVIAPAAATLDAQTAILDRARRRGFRRFLLEASQLPLALPSDETTERVGDQVRPGGPSAGLVTLTRLSNPAELDAAVQHTPSGGFLVVEWTGDRLIPLENAIAAKGRRFQLWVYARALREVPGALGALEHGADRVIIDVDSAARVDELEALLEGASTGPLDWSLVEVATVRPAGLGDRVIVDTTSLLSPEEGLLVGSAAGFLFHVASEAVGSRFSRARPFRVNAGAAHSYVLLSDGTTRYLAELEPGDSVLSAIPNGRSRSVRVGRLKIERRPLVVVTAHVGEQARTVFLQEAETVRLSGETDRYATTDLRAGARVYGAALAQGRHLGHPVEETIIER